MHKKQYGCSDINPLQYSRKKVVVYSFWWKQTWKASRLETLNVKNVIGLFDPFSCCYGLRHFDVKLRPYVVISHVYESRSSIPIIYSFFLITLLGNKNYISLLGDSCKQVYLEPDGFASCKFDPCADVSTGVGSHSIYIPYGACSRGLTTGISCTISRINT